MALILRQAEWLRKPFPISALPMAPQSRDTDPSSSSCLHLCCSEATLNINGAAPGTAVTSITALGGLRLPSQGEAEAVTGIQRASVASQGGWLSGLGEDTANVRHGRRPEPSPLPPPQHSPLARRSPSSGK